MFVKRKEIRGKFETHTHIDILTIQFWVFFKEQT